MVTLDLLFAQNVAELAPVFVAPPSGSEFRRPDGWPHLNPDGNEVRLKEWQHGYAVCAVTGGRLAVVDVDPRNGGDTEEVRRVLAGLNVRVFAEVSTPGGGSHLYVAGHPDLPTTHDLIGFAGVDVQSQGAHVFLPGTLRPKYGGRGYTVCYDNLAALDDGGDPDGAEALLGWVTNHRAASPPTTPPPPMGDPPDERQAAYLTAVLDNQSAEVANATAGTRNGTLYRAALKCGSFVAGAGLDEQETVSKLFAAATASGLAADDGDTQVYATIHSGLQNGKANPRGVPDAPGITVLSEPVGAGAHDREAGPYAFVPGGTFILDTPPDPQPIWGIGSEVLLADGEALIIAGDQGLGKTTLGQQLALGRCGIPEYGDLLGYPIQPGARRTLYLAMDRPRQAARSFRRMVGEAWRAELDDRLVVWQGPPPADLAKYPGLLLDLCRKADADTVALDSLKDAAVGLNDDETGAGYNRARQTAVAAGVQVIELHHNRKAQQGMKGTPSISDVYGSTWLTSGVGSVLLLTGSPGDPIVGLRHLKQPADEVGPLRIIHDHTTGRSEIFHTVDLLTLARQPISAMDAARALFEADTPSQNQREKARRRLDKGVRDGLFRVVQQGDRAANTPTLWVAEGPSR